MTDSHTMSAGEGHVTVTPHRARVVAVTLGPDGQNQFHDDGAGGGGDRLWIAPEPAFHWEDVDQARDAPFEHYHVPECVEPGRYQRVDAGPRHITLANEGVDLTDHRVGKRILFDVLRQVRIIDAPAGLPPGLATASFAITNTLTLRGGDDGAVAEGWDLLQLPRGGTIICPTVTPLETMPTPYFEPFEDSVTLRPDAVWFKVDGKRQIKMGLPPEVTTGRMGYIHGNTLIVRIFTPLIGETYVDVPLFADRKLRRGRDCLQTYSDDDTFGPFGELEYHDPALVVGAQPNVRSGTSVTHVITGEASDVRAAAMHLLGVSVDGA